MDAKSWELEIIGNCSNISAILEKQLQCGDFPWQVFWSDSLALRRDASSSCLVLDIPQEELDADVVSQLAAQRYMVICIDKDAPFEKELMECGVHDFLRRPIEPAEFLLKLRNMRRLLEKNRDAMLDYLTELPNRRALYRYYARLSKDLLVSFFFIDIDNFKEINDTFGHRFGDDVLVEIADELRRLAPGAFISRMGGDEFVLLFEGESSRQEMEQIAKEMLSALDRCYRTEKGQKEISASIGMLLDKTSGISLDQQLACCDQAMYRIKRNGKNQYHIHQE